MKICRSSRIWRWRAGGLCALIVAGFVSLILPGSLRAAATTEPQLVSPIVQDLRSFNCLGSVLLVAAHPDDENTQLLAYLARGRVYRTAYLSVTRGDGGQNVLGPEFGQELGLIRTHELLSARQLDGARQFFTRALDFGFSKDYQQTLSVWDHQQVVADVVRVIRTFRPDVVVTRFSTLPSNTHGHHTASAVVALEAFKVCGDPKAFPEQLKELAPWQPKRIMLNGFAAGFRPAGQEVPGAANTNNAIRIDVSGNDPVTGESFSAIAGRSRAMHKTQGFGNAGGGGRGGRGGGAGGARPESFQLLDGEPAAKDILDGVDTTWGRFPGAAEIGQLTDDAIAKFNPQDSSASVPALLAIRARLNKLPTDPVIDEKRQQLDRILQTCLGLSVQTTVAQAEVVPGESLKMQHRATVKSAVPVRWMGVRYPITKAQINEPIDLKSDQETTRDQTQTLPANLPLSQPYWLREDGTAGMFRVDEASLIGQPINPPSFPIEQIFEVGGQTLVIPDEPVAGPRNRQLDVIPPVALNFGSDVQLFAAGASHPATVEVTAYRAGAAGILHLEAPSGWTVSPSTQNFNLAAVGDHAKFTFTIQGPPQLASADIIAHVEINGRQFDNKRVEINYPHIPFLLLQPPARLKAIGIDLAIRGKNVGYIAGAGDSVAESIEQMGYTVTELAGTDLTAEKLKGLDAVVIGIRAFNVRKDLATGMPALFDFIKAGGNVIAQYNRPDGLQTNQLAPYDLRIANLRVTDRNSTMTFLAPDHPVVNTPNKITAADFQGWVQERGIYFPQTWDAKFTPIFACNDSGESPLKGSLLVADYGKGHFIYTGLVFFRELPAGVPGAYRLMANLVSLGK
jgi:LmbE family N-acetylglucosaminyl deacetylase